MLENPVKDKFQEKVKIGDTIYTKEQVLLCIFRNKEVPQKIKHAFEKLYKGDMVLARSECDELFHRVQKWQAVKLLIETPTSNFKK